MVKGYIKCQNSIDQRDRATGTVKIGGKKEPICIPSNTTLTVPGITSKLNAKWTYLFEQAEHNLPNNLVVNSCYITPKARRV